MFEGTSASTRSNAPSANGRILNRSQVFPFGSATHRNRHRAGYNFTLKEVDKISIHFEIGFLINSVVGFNRTRLAKRLAWATSFSRASAQAICIQRRQTIQIASRTILPLIFEVPTKRSVKMIGTWQSCTGAPENVRQLDLKAVAVGLDPVEVNRLQRALETRKPPVGSVNGIPVMARTYLPANMLSKAGSAAS